jgi:hypothetical protein
MTAEFEIGDIVLFDHPSNQEDWNLDRARYIGIITDTREFAGIAESGRVTKYWLYWGHKGTVKSATDWHNGEYFHKVAHVSNMRSDYPRVELCP